MGTDKLGFGTATAGQRAMPLPSEHPIEDSSPRKRRLLVAEDNAALRDYLVAILRAEGYDVAEASTADDLVDTLAVSLRPDVGSGKFDLVIAEDRLAIRGALTLAKEPSAREKMPPFVLIGSFSDRDSTARALGPNAVVRFAKPLDMDSFRDAVRCLTHIVAETRQSRKGITGN